MILDVYKVTECIKRAKMAGDLRCINITTGRRTTETDIKRGAMFFDYDLLICCPRVYRQGWFQFKKDLVTSGMKRRGVLHYDWSSDSDDTRDITEEPLSHILETIDFY